MVIYLNGIKIQKSHWTWWQHISLNLEHPSIILIVVLRRDTENGMLLYFHGTREGCYAGDLGWTMMCRWTIGRVQHEVDQRASSGCWMDGPVIRYIDANLGEASRLEGLGIVIPKHNDLLPLPSFFHLTHVQFDFNNQTHLVCRVSVFYIHLPTGRFGLWALLPLPSTSEQSALVALVVQST